MNLKHINVPVYGVKALDDSQGILEAFVSVYGNIDCYNERMIYGCFGKGLTKRSPNGLFMHNWEQPVAKTLKWEEIQAGDPRLPSEIKEFGGLYIKGQYNLETQRGKETFSDLKNGIVNEFSIGYQEIKASWNTDRKCKDVQEVMMYEWSSVIVGANDMTIAVSAKDASKKTKAQEIVDKVKSQYLGEEVEESMTFSALYTLDSYLLWNLLWECCYNDSMKKADRLQMVAEGCKEFADLALKVMGALLPEDGGDNNEEVYETMRLELEAFRPSEEKSLLSSRDGKQVEKGLEALRDFAKQVHAKVSAIGALRAKDRKKEGRVFSTANTQTILDDVGELRSIADDLENMVESSREEKSTDMQLLIQKTRAKKFFKKQ